jgi:pyroglutamyl-peptidase
MPTILITGFGPFPGSPYNPTCRLVQRLVRLRRPRLADAKIVAHIFPTSYAAVDLDLPKLIAKHRPDALLMFGLAPRAHWLRIETRARNSVVLLPDVSGVALASHTIRPRGPAVLSMPAPAQRLLAAIRTTRVPAALSRDAGRYLCNYLCWRAAEATGNKNGPRLAAFVHVPKVARFAHRPGKLRKLTLDDLTRAGGALLAGVAGLV